jgi:hypothetical protein
LERGCNRLLTKNPTAIALLLAVGFYQSWRDPYKVHKLTSYLIFTYFTPFWI